MISGDEIRGAQISAHRFREGYDVDEVDKLLDEAADTIDYLQRTHVHMHITQTPQPMGKPSALVLQARDLITQDTHTSESKSLQDTCSQLTHIYKYLRKIERSGK